MTTTIIAIEGIDGAGKNTLTQALAQRLNARTISFPQYGTTVYADTAAAELKNPTSNHTPMAMATLFALDRFEALPELTKPGLIIVDRYTASNIAYTAAQQIITHGKSTAYADITAMEERLGIPKADATIFVSTPPETAQKRAEHRELTDDERRRDRYEKDNDLQYQAYRYYSLLASTQPTWIATHPGDTIDHTIDHITEHLTAKGLL